MRSSVVVEREADFEGDLVVGHLAVFDMAARLHHLEPADLPQGARRTADGVVDRVLDALLRRACDFDDPVNVIRHRHPPLARPGRPGGSVRLSENACGLTLVPLRPYLMRDRPCRGAGCATRLLLSRCGVVPHIARAGRICHRSGALISRGRDTAALANSDVSE